MKYRKGNFVVVPNLENLRCKPTEMQAIFMWICSYANEEGSCFPSRKRLARDCGLTDRTVDKYMKQLVEEGFISKKYRSVENSKQKLSNMYNILQLNRVEDKELKEYPERQVAETKGLVKPYVQKGATLANEDTEGGVSNLPVTISSNYTNRTIKQPEVVTPFSLESEVTKLESSKWKPNKILALYFRFKKLKFENKAQFDSETKRFLKVAISLQGYNSKQLVETMQYCEDNYKDIGWILPTVLKRVALIVNKQI